MKKSTKIASIAVVTVALIGGTTAFAGKHRSGDHEERAEMAAWFVDKKLDLDATQEQALSLLKDQILVAMTTMHSESATTRDDIRSLVSAETFDQGKALDLITSKTASVDSLAPDLVVAFAGFMDSLNTEQKQEILEVMDSHKGRHGHKRWGR